MQHSSRPVDQVLDEHHERLREHPVIGHRLGGGRGLHGGRGMHSGFMAGASGFMLKDAPPEELVAAVRIVASGEALLSEGLQRTSARCTVSRFSSGPGPRKVRGDESALTAASSLER